MGNGTTVLMKTKKRGNRLWVSVGRMGNGTAVLMKNKKRGKWVSVGKVRFSGFTH